MKMWIRVGFVAITLLFAPFGMCGCLEGEVLLYEDGDNWYCDTRGNIEKDQKESVAALATAARSPFCAFGDYCNYFVAKIGELRNVPYFRDVMYPRKKEDHIGGPNEYRKANEIYGFISRAVASKASGWKAVTGQIAQSMADKGRFVIGVASNKDPEKSGHIAIVVPSGLPKQHSSVSGGPWVMDAQSPERSVEAGVYRFVSPALNKVIWAVWMGN